MRQIDDQPTEGMIIRQTAHAALDRWLDEYVLAGPAVDLEDGGSDSWQRLAEAIEGAANCLLAIPPSRR